MTYQIGEHVASYNSGLVYTIKAVRDLDLVGTKAYLVRRLRGGVEYGPTRIIGEHGLVPLSGGNHDKLTSKPYGGHDLHGVACGDATPN